MQGILALCWLIFVTSFALNQTKVQAQVDFTGLNNSYCITDAPVTLVGSQAPIGTFTGPGITDNGNGTATFNPATAGSGGTITYTGSISNWASVSAGYSHTLAIKTDGTLWAWGNNDYGQLGDGTNISRINPVQIGTATNWASVSAQRYHTLARKTDGTLWAWGRNTYGQLGIGSTINKNSPIQIGTSSNWVSITAGGNHSFGIKANGTLWAWGFNGYGQLGIGNATNQNSPVQIGTDTNWANIAAGVNHSFARKTDGTLWAWGYNVYGQLGIGNTINQNIPIQIDSDTNWANIAAGGAHNLACKTDGTLWAWGGNYDGQLGDGTNINRNTPVQIDTNSDHQNIAVGFEHSLAQKTDGTLWAWGYNIYGQLGTGNTVSQNTPTQIGTDTNWTNIAVGGAHSLARKTNGTLWAWGQNHDGQLGIENIINQNSPVLVGSKKSQTVVVNVIPTIIFSNITNPICGTGSIGAYASTIISPYTILWNIGATTSTINNLVADTYTVTVTSGGCTSIASATLTNADLNIPTGLITTNISSTSAKLNWTAVSGATNYTIQGRRTGSNWITIGPLIGTSKTINSQISACMTYEWKVKANCSYSVTSSEYSNTATFTTTGCGVSGKTDSELVAEWDGGFKTFSLSPTPANNLVTLYYSTETETPLNISIIDVTGRVVAQQNAFATQGDNTINLATNQLPQGYYVVELNDGTTKMHEKLLIARQLATVYQLTKTKSLIGLG